MKPAGLLAWGLFVLLPLLGASSARAADTVETWDVGATDLDFYLGYDGIGAGNSERRVYSDIMLGYGIIDRLSAYLGTTLQGNGLFDDGQANIYLGIFGTPLETAHFDIDLFLDFSVGGAGLSEFQAAPAVEFNFDHDPQMRSWGAYLRVSMPVQARSIASDTSNATEPDLAFSVLVNPGMYLTIAERHQLLVEYDMTFHNRPVDTHQVDIGGVALGYNVKLSATLELINQVYLDIPQQDEVVTAAVTIGFIGTLPSAVR